MDVEPIKGKLDKLGSYLERSKQKIGNCGQQGMYYYIQKVVDEALGQSYIRKKL